MQAATAAQATSPPALAPDACPPAWPALHAGPPSGGFDGNVSVLVGGNLQVTGTATGAEGTVVALGDALFARTEPGSYAIGVTALGSQVPPYAGSDMLVVGGNLGATAGTHLDVGAGLGGDVVVGGGVVDGTDLDPHGESIDQAVAGATGPYLDLAAQLAPMSAGYAGFPLTGAVEVTDETLTLVGDGVSPVQVFTVDGSSLPTPEDGGRALQLRDVPQDAAVVVNLTGTAVRLDIDELRSPDGSPVDPQADPYFASLATHLLWNAPSAATVDVSGRAQLPGSLLVPTAPSTTTLSGAGTNGRVLVGGDLVHTGTGELHAYPYPADPRLACGADPVHLTSLKLAVVLDDPEAIVDHDRFFEGEFACLLGDVDVTPPDHSWRMRAGNAPRVLSDEIPSGAVCSVVERLDFPPAPLRAWAAPEITPDVLVAAKRHELGVTVTNRVKKAATTPPPTSQPTTQPTPTAPPTPTESAPEPPAPPPSTPESTPTATSVVEPTNRPPLPSSPSAQPTPGPTSSASPGAEETPTPSSDPPRQDSAAGPFTTTAPFTLRGAFVWGPVMMLSLLTLLVRIRRRPKRMH